MEHYERHVAVEEDEHTRQQPLGQRLDSSRASLEQAVERSEKAERAVEVAQQQLEEAAAEVKQRHAQVLLYKVEAVETALRARMTKRKTTWKRA